MKSQCIALTTLVLLASTQPASFASNDLYYKYKQIATQALARKDYAMAEVMYARALEQAELYDQTDPRLVSCLTALANLYAKQNEYALAEPLYQRLIALTERHPELDNQVASALTNYSKMEARTHRTDKSELFKQLASVLQTENPSEELGNAGLGM
jgi:tetratricopeptide (TPR) repeat protein